MLTVTSDSNVDIDHSDNHCVSCAVTRAIGVRIPAKANLICIMYAELVLYVCE